MTIFNDINDDEYYSDLDVLFAKTVVCKSCKEINSELDSLCVSCGAILFLDFNGD